MKEKNTIGLILARAFPEFGFEPPEPPDEESWFVEAAHALGIEKGSGSVGYLGDGPVIATAACRFNGQRISAIVDGSDDDECRQKLLDALAQEVARLRHGGPAGSGNGSPVG